MYVQLSTKKAFNNLLRFPEVVFFSHLVGFTVALYDPIGLPGCANALGAHHRGLNSLPVSTDRKRLNGMLCLSAF